MADAAQLPGESALQYMLRQGMDPNAASGALVGSMTGNVAQTGTDPLGTQLVKRARASNTVKATGVAQPDWFGNNTNDPNNPYYAPPVAFNPDTAQQGGWVGQTYNPNLTSSGIIGAATTPTPAATPTATPAATQPGSTQTAGATTQPGAFTGTAPTTLDEFYALDHNQRAAWQAANPGGLQAIIDAHNRLLSDQGLGPGAATQPGGSTATTNASTLPPMNSGETSSAYMQRIGMSPAQIQQALTMSQQNPGMSFQQIYAAVGAGTGAGTTVPGPGGQPVTVGNTPTSGGPFGNGTAPGGQTLPGDGMWSGNTVPAVGTPGTPGYQPAHNIAPNIVQTTHFANPAPTYSPQSAPLSPLSTPTNPASTPQIDPQTGQVVTSGVNAGTVQGQLDNILKDGNPLLEAARTRAAQAANSRGLINSSMAAQAGEEAVLNAALPIAQQDAQTMENRALVNQNITNQFLSMREGTRLDLQKAYEAFKQNNYAFDKNAALQTYLNDSGISNQQKIAALQAAVSQANTATNVQGELERTGMTLTAQQWLTNNVPSTALMQIGATNLANYASGLANIMSSQLEPDAKANAIANWNAVWAGQNLGGLVINGVQALPVDPLAGSPVNGSPTGSVPTNPAGPGQTSGG